MKKLSEERIYEFAYAFADYTFKHNITDDEREDYLEDDMYLHEIIDRNSDDYIQYLSEDGWYEDENEKEVIENNCDNIIDEIIKEAVWHLREMLEAVVEN